MALNIFTNAHQWSSRHWIFWTFIGLKRNNHQLSQICLTFHVYHKWCCPWKRHVWSAMKIQCDVCHVCSLSPSGARCFTYIPSGTGWMLFKQCWWARNTAQSAPQWCSLWWMSKGVKYRLPFFVAVLELHVSISLEGFVLYSMCLQVCVFMGVSACRFCCDLYVLNSVAYAIIFRGIIYTVHVFHLSTVSLLTPQHLKRCWNSYAFFP